MSTIIGNPIMLGGGGGISAPIIGKDFNWTGGDGTYQVLEDGGGNWRIKFLSSGVFTPLKKMTIDVFLVGAGGGGAACGGGSGYTATKKSIVVLSNNSYSIEIGDGGTGSTVSSTAGGDGGRTSAFSVTAKGGVGGKGGTYRWHGGDGGSGGGAYNAGGGVDGANGSNNPDSSTYKGGTGQGTTTREFGEASGDLYASGGSGVLNGATAGADNTGDGGDNGKAGGSGIAIIRKHKEAAA